MEITKEDAEYIKNELAKSYILYPDIANPHNRPSNPTFDYKEYQELKQEVHRLKLIESTIKPYEKRYKQDPGVLRVDLPISVPEIYNMSRLSSILRTVHLNIKNEIFRRGLRWKKRFAVKCIKCEKEFATEPAEGEFKCECGSLNYRYPDTKPLRNLERFLTAANKNQEPLLDVFKECEYDLEIIDDAFLILIKEYIILDKKIIGSRIKEVIRGDPEFLRIIGNEKSERGGRYWICPTHRNIPLTGVNITDAHEKMLGRHYESPGKCPVCGLDLAEVMYVSVGGARSMDPEQYYIDGEILHLSKYSPSRTYGYPPVLSIWKEASTLLNMQHFINEYFKYMRAPRGILMAVTANIESAYKKWDQILENIKRDPHYIPMLAIQDNGTGKRQNQFQWLNFSNTLQEMEYGNVRDELRIRISSLYGVSNVMMGDTKGGGGIGNEGLQIVVSDRAVQWGQEVWNQNLFPEFCRQLDIFDYVLELRPNIELVEQKKNEIQLQRIQIAEAMFRMGFNVELDNEGNFKFSGKALDLRERMINDKKQPEANASGDKKIVTEDHTSGLSTGQKMLDKTPRGSKMMSYT